MRIPGIKISALTLAAFWLTSHLWQANAADGNIYTAQDIGNPGPPGAVATLANGFNLTAGGSDIGGTSDQFTFNYQTCSGDFDVKVRVEGLDLSDPWAKAGLMARATLTTNSAFAAVFATPSI